MHGLTVVLNFIRNWHILICADEDRSVPPKLPLPDIEAYTAVLPRTDPEDARVVQVRFLFLYLSYDLFTLTYLLNNLIWYLRIRRQAPRRNVSQPISPHSEYTFFNVNKVGEEIVRTDLDKIRLRNQLREQFMRL